jgi:hypothetical protein
LAESSILVGASKNWAKIGSALIWITISNRKNRTNVSFISLYFNVNQQFVDNFKVELNVNNTSAPYGGCRSELGSIPRLYRNISHPRLHSRKHHK